MRPEDLDPNEPAVPGITLTGGAATWRQYAGKVIAVSGGMVRASGDTWGAALEAARRAGLALEELSFIAVPTGAVIG